MSIEIRLITCIRGKFIGNDEFGNRYYISRFKDNIGRLRRWVVYKGKDEPSKVPPLWHAWLHYMSDVVPESIVNYKWQRQKVQNLTGTDHAYLPPGHIMSGGKRAKTGGDYQAWQP